MERKTSYKYDAFISYRQVEPDKNIANRLHRSLEKYKIPTSLVKEGYPKRLSRIFKDIEELSASSNLSKSINKALIDSKYLIVICSPRTKESKWIKEEIDTFISLGKENKILTLIIEGEIEDSIPKELININKIPLAADIRNNNSYFLFDKFHDAKLKIISPIIGCDYDDLYQREKKRSRIYFIFFTATMAVIAIVFIFLSISLNKSNKVLIKTNKKLNQAIFETSAIYAQFLLPVQNNYEKWGKATNKIIKIIKQKDIDKALKANNILSKYISLKGYNAGKGTDIYPFWENPKYFLKTLFFRKNKFTTGHIEDRYMSLFLLDSLEFPSNLFLFLAEPPIKLPSIYQRMQSDVINKDLIRYGYFLQAINYEINEKHKKSFESLKKSAENGFFHSLTGVLSPLSLDSIYRELYVFNEKKLKNVHKLENNERFMTNKEKTNLVKNLNIYFLISINFSSYKNNYLKLLDKPISSQDEDYGKISYLNISNYILDKIVSSNKEINSLLTVLKSPPLTADEIKLKNRYIKEISSSKNNFYQELTQLALETRSKLSDLNREVEGSEELKKLTKNRSDVKETVKIWLGNNFKNNIFLRSRDVRYIDTLIEDLSENSLHEFKSILKIPANIVRPKEIRIYISKIIRPYTFSIKSYDYFISNDDVFNILLEIHKKEPNNIHVKFSIARYWKIRRNKKKYFFYSSSINDDYFNNIERLLPKIE